MLIHIVCFKYKPGTDLAIRTQHHERLHALKDIDGIVDLKVGGDVVRSPRSYDAALVVTFRDRAAHDAYQRHPRHVPVAQFGREHAESVIAVDFESPA